MENLKIVDNTDEDIIRRVDDLFKDLDRLNDMVVRINSVIGSIKQDLKDMDMAIESVAQK